MILTKSIQDFIESHASETMDEVCGLIIVKDGEYIPYRCKNVSSNPKEHFIVDPFDYLSITQKGEIVAVYHSHSQDNFFSIFDIDQVKFNNLIYILYYIPKKTFNIIDPQNSYCKYLGRKFSIGFLDCFTLVKDFYSNEFQIQLNDYSRDKNWYTKNPKLIEDNFSKEGFVEVKDLKFGDIILFSPSVSSAAKHLGIYIGSNLFLHQSDKDDSNISLYTSIYKHTTKYILRHRKNI